MTSSPVPNDLQEALDNFGQQSPEAAERASELLRLLQRARERKAELEENDEDCPEGDDDCDEIKSPCCSGELRTVFGTLPLMVECTECDQRYPLKEIMDGLPKK